MCCKCSSFNGIEKYPKLRFQGFTIPWTEIEIGKAFQVTRGYVLPATVVRQDASEEYIYPVYSSQTKDNGLMGYYNDYLYENAITWTTDGANAGTVHYRSGKFYCTNVCGVLLSDEGNANRCVAEILGSVSKKYVSYVGNPKLMNNVMSEIKIYVPTIAEQKKIDDFISVIDHRIEKQHELIEYLKKYKRGLLQAVFSREIQLENSSNWEHRLFGEIASLGKGKYTPKQEEILPCIELEHLEQQTGQIIGYANSNEQNSVKSVFHKGDVLFGKLRPYLRKFALPEYDGVCSSEIWVLHPESNIDSTFLFYLIQSESFIAAANISSGTKMPRAEWSKVSNESFFIPELSEQKRIADLLSTIDKRIVNASRSVNKMQSGTSENFV